MLKVSPAVLANIQRGLLVRKVNLVQLRFIVVRQIAANKIKMSTIWVTVLMKITTDTFYYLSECRKKSLVKKNANIYVSSIKNTNKTPTNKQTQTSPNQPTKQTPVLEKK